MRTAWFEARYLWVGGIVVLAVALFYLTGRWGFWVKEAAMLWFLGLLVFFRDPDRSADSHPGAIVAPADGKVMVIAEEFEPTFLKAPAKRVSIFLSIFDVHVQRAPVAGSVEWMQHTPGKFMTAWKPEASVENERQAIGINGSSQKVLVHQIAGLIARRIVGWVKPGDSVSRGDRIGMIKFGSRVDVFLPASVDLSVKVGDRVKGGSDVIATMSVVNGSRPLAMAGATA